MQTTRDNKQLQTALARWDNEGGAVPDRPQESSSASPVTDGPYALGTGYLWAICRRVVTLARPNTGKVMQSKGRKT